VDEEYEIVEETSEPEPEVLLESWAGTVILLSDALMRVFPPLDKNDKKRGAVYSEHLDLLLSSLKQATRMHNIISELSLLSSIANLTERGLDGGMIHNILEKNKETTKTAPSVVKPMTTEKI
jgi:hypothetical protein